MCVPGITYTPFLRTIRGSRPLVRGTLNLVEVPPLPKWTRVPQRLRLWWHAPAPPRLSQIWLAYVARFGLEHTFLEVSQFLHWTLPRVRHPEQFDRWT
jgi:hypothetical protein